MLRIRGDAIEVDAVARQAVEQLVAQPAVLDGAAERPPKQREHGAAEEAAVRCGRADGVVGRRWCMRRARRWFGLHCIEELKQAGLRTSDRPAVGLRSVLKMLVPSVEIIRVEASTRKD